MATTVRPLADRVIVKPIEAASTTASGIVLPDSAKETPQLAEVIAVGPGKFDDGQRQPLEVKVGQKVYYSRYAGDDVKIDGIEHKIISENEILAIVE